MTDVFFIIAVIVAIARSIGESQAKARAARQGTPLPRPASPRIPAGMPGQPYGTMPQGNYTAAQQPQQSWAATQQQVWEQQQGFGGQQNPGVWQPPQPQPQAPLGGPSFGNMPGQPSGWNQPPAAGPQPGWGPSPVAEHQPGWNQPPPFSGQRGMSPQVQVGQPPVGIRHQRSPQPGLQRQPQVSGPVDRLATTASFGTLEAAIEEEASTDPIVSAAAAQAPESPLAKILKQPNSLLAAFVMHEVLSPPRLSEPRMSNRNR